MTIIAFLQNMWVKHPDQWTEFFEKHPEKWNDMVKHNLFADNCITGSRIKQAFGEELTNKIIFEECTAEIAGSPKTVIPADKTHITKALERLKPDIVITFGKIAFKAVKDCYDGELIECVHPACRLKDVMDRLYKAVKEVEDKLNQNKN